MKTHINRAMWRPICGVAISITLLVSFQNCGKAGFDGTGEEVASSTSDAALTAKYGESTAQKVAAIPFAFDASFDQIAYNSCARNGLATSKGYFTISAGAYGDFGGGVRIKDNFFNYADSNFKAIYPETSLTENQYREYLADSPENNGAQPMMAIRTSNSLTDIHSANNSATLGADIQAMLSNLTDSLLMVSLTQKGTVASYLPFSSEQKVLEGKLTFNTTEALAQSFRDDLMGAGVLTVTYTKTSGQLNEVRGPASAVSTYPVKKAYGRSYKLGFGNVAAPASSGTVASNPNNILTDIWESDLESPSTGIQWNCDYNRRYLIVRSQDAASCPQEDASKLSDANYRKELQIIRRHLRADQWDVNVERRCAVPKSGTSLACYTEETVNGAAVGVNYARNAECFQSNKDASSYSSSTIPTARCAQFVSVCTRY